MLKGIEGKEARLKINRATPLDTIISIVNQVGGSEMNVHAVVKETKVDTLKFITKYTWKARNIKLLFSEDHKEIALVGDRLSKKERNSDNLKLVLTTEERVRRLRETLPSGVKIIGPADRKDSTLYRELLPKAKDRGLTFDEQPVPFKKKSVEVEEKPIKPDEEDIGTTSTFEDFVIEAKRNRVDEIKVEIYPYKKIRKFKDKNCTVYVPYGMKIQAELPDGSEISFIQCNIIVPENDFIREKDLIALKLLATSRYYSEEIDRRLKIPTKSPVDNMDSRTRHEMKKAVKDNKIIPFDLPKFPEFLGK